jgi:hypothetical protein
MYICKIYISKQNLKYSILLMGLDDVEQSYIAMARMEDRQGENPVPVAGEVCHHYS